MLRRLFTLLSALSLVLCAATCVLWVRSFSALDRVIYFTAVGPRGLDGIELTSYTGFATVLWDHYGFPPSDRDAYVARASRGRVAPEFVWTVEPYTDGQDYLARRDNFGVGWFRYDVERKARMWRTPGITSVRRVASVPQAAIALTLLACPAAWVYRWVRLRRRARVGLCLGCGYDLRATPDRCPECGAVPVSRCKPEGT